jgi:hypothetical protein
MLETLWDRTEVARRSRRSRRGANSFVILPGVRGAINLPYDLQIVPGIGVPIGIGPSKRAP